MKTLGAMNMIMISMSAKRDATVVEGGMVSNAMVSVMWIMGGPACQRSELSESATCQDG